ncbi:MAG: multidrug effflux MFS transporter [Dehalococcoidia bacterium]|nr:multidrug effflux MFS transporter [Dehalococcoidia bacterium]
MPFVRREPTLRIAIFLIALSATAPISVDTFLPSMPDIVDEFGSTEAFLTLGVTLFLVSFAASQLVYGPASDKWGRRPILFIGLSIYVLGGIMCLSATSAEMLIAGRVLQGLGGGVGPALANAMVLDLFSREGATKMIGYQAIVMPLAPAIAPIIGGAIASAAGWRAVFVVLAGFGVFFASWYAVTLGETRPPRAPSRAGLRGDYRTLLTSPTFLGFALVMGLMFSGQLLFVSTSSFVLIDHMGVSPTAFGFAFGFMALGFMAGATTSSRLVGKYKGHHIVMAGATIAGAAAGMLLLLVLAGVEHPLIVIVATFVQAIGIGLSRPSAMAGALVPFPHIAGVASSTLMFVQMALSSGYNVIYSMVFEPGVTSLAAGMFVPITLGFFVAWFVGTRVRRAEREAAERPPEAAAAG